MQKDIQERVISEAEFLVRYRGTVRALSPLFKVSKITIHYDLTRRLKKLDETLFDDVQKILQINKNTRHIRGGLATKEKYSKMKKS